MLVLCLIAFIPLAEATPKIHHWTLDNGTRVYFVETHELPMLQIRAVFDAGASRDPANRAGLARLTVAVLDPQPIGKGQRRMPRPRGGGDVR